MNASTDTPPMTVGEHLQTRIPVAPVAIAVIGLLAALLNPVQPVTEGRVSSTNPVLLLKLATAASAWVITVWSLLRSHATRQTIATTVGIALATLSATMLVAGILSPTSSRLISVAAALILIGYLGFVTASLSAIGFGTLARALVLGLAMYLGIAWLIYLLFPSFGEFHEYVDATTTVARMGGVAHPNAIAHEASTAVLLVIASLFGTTAIDFKNDSQVQSRWRLFDSAVLCLAAATLVATLSRTAVLATVIASAMILFDRLYSRKGMLLANLGLIAALAAFLVYGLASGKSPLDSAVSKVTKSGNVEELTSLTGRTRIWQEALTLIGERWWIGYGMDSAATVMSPESVGTHNLMFHILFSGGIVAGGIVVMLLLITLQIAIRSPQPLFRGIATYVLVSGLVEDTILPAFPASLTMLWMAMLLLHSQTRSRLPTV
ncbi:O-antigen ligase family protein [Rhodopirellula sp. MGV]|uniref:O-antigen ligase family protein n=1 Tax=Rhodopirellula sp. MGV TaxID=2023130 RepID=UPI00130456D4|nr:O-antigen ligase family protein [Rhodopirellula sp. MGV]